MNEAITLAKSHGYELSDFWKDYPSRVIEALASQDPLFWKSLGKALGWKTERVCVACEFEGSHEMRNYQQEPGLYHALRYHELVLTDGDTDKFWKELLNNVGVSQQPEGMKNAA